MLTVLLSHDRVGQEAHIGFKSMKGLKHEEGKIQNTGEPFRGMGPCGRFELSTFNLGGSFT